MISLEDAQRLALKKYKTYNSDEIEQLITKAALRGDFFISEIGIIEDDTLEELDDMGFTVSGGMSAGCQPIFNISWNLEDYFI